MLYNTFIILPSWFHGKKIAGYDKALWQHEKADLQHPFFCWQGGNQPQLSDFTFHGCAWQEGNSQPSLISCWQKDNYQVSLIFWSQGGNQA
jgi:hypothetical protein